MIFRSILVLPKRMGRVDIANINAQVLSQDGDRDVFLRRPTLSCLDEREQFTQTHLERHPEPPLRLWDYRNSSSASSHSILTDKSLLVTGWTRSAF
jgi:hypothetical protein